VELVIGKAIKWHLEVNGCSQYKLAARMCMSRAGVKGFCGDDANPRFDTLCKIARALNISVVDIVMRAEIIRSEEE
jgi:transcriptional regulator with XRE-family HTH domain